jgi:hypothetical protein
MTRFNYDIIPSKTQVRNSYQLAGRLGTIARRCYDRSSVEFPRRSPNHTRPLSYAPRYSPLPRAVHAALSVPPRKRPRIPLSPVVFAKFFNDFPCFLLFSTSSMAVFSELSPAADSMILVFTTSTGVVITAAKEPALPALIAVIIAVSLNVPIKVPLSFLYSLIFVFKCSNMGNCIAVKGKFRAASAV